MLAMKTEEELLSVIRGGSPYSLCRICLTDSSLHASSIFQALSRDSVAPCVKIMICTQIEMRESDGLPDLICDACCRALDLADNFRMKCKSSDSLLKRIFFKVESEGEHIRGKDKSSSVEEMTPLSLLKSLLESEHVDRLKEEAAEVSLVARDGTALSNAVDLATSEQPTLDIVIKCEAEDYLDADEMEDSSGEARSIKVRKKKSSKKSKSFCCHLCREPLKDKRSLKKHIKLMHILPSVPDSVEVTGFGEERFYHCKDCNYKTKYRKNITPHLRTHTGEKPYKCEECGKCYAQNDSLLSHKTTHSDRMNFTCAECGKQFKYKKGLIKHKRAHSTEKNYRCTLCSKAMKSRYSLEDHMNRHFNIRNFSCETCGDIFVTRSGLSNHVRRVHIPNKKFQCHICEYATYAKEKLDIHIRRHTGERTHNCELCDYSCYTRSSLTAHMKRHTKDKDFGCSECESRFKHKSGLRRHLYTVHGKRVKPVFGHFENKSPVII